jgi:DNA-binding transcriptional ArsR family regulator
MISTTDSLASDSLGNTLLALADPVRRQVVKMLQERPHRAGEIAAAFDVSGPAISKHLRVLRRSRLIAETGDANDARIRIYRLQPQPFDELGDWVEGIRAFWAGQLGSFKDLAVAHANTAAASTTAAKSRPARRATKAKQSKRSNPRR